MTINWNPGSPNKVGIELLDVGIGHMAINAPNIRAIQRWKAIRTGEIDDVEFHSAPTGALSPILDDRYNQARRPMIVDLVPAGSELEGTISSTQYEVTTVTGGPGMINENFSTPINANRLQTSNDGLFIASGNIGAAFQANFGTSAFPLDRHVVGVEVVMRINLTTNVHHLDPVLGLSSPWYSQIPMFSPSFQLATVRMGETIIEGSSTTWKHWTPAMIREFATVSRRIRIACAAGPGYWRIDRLALKVYWMPERRRGVGIGSPTNNTWVNFDMTTPNATGSPSVTAGESMSWIIRWINDYSVDTVAGFTSMPWRVLNGRAPVYDEWKRLNGSLVGINGIGTVRVKDAVLVEDDSVPYNLSRGARVFSGQNASQFLSIPAGSIVYGQAFVVAGWIPVNGFPTEPLRCEVYRVSDGVRVFSPIEITADDASRLPVSAPISNVDDEGAVYKTLRYRFPESLDLSTGSHEVRLSSATSEDRPWHIGCLFGPDHIDNQTYGTTTQYATGVLNLSGTYAALSGDDWTADLLVQLGDVPAAVTGVAVAEGSLTVHHADVCDVNAGCAGCRDETLPYAYVTWTAAPTGSPAVTGYHVDRQDDLSPDWERVATIWGRTNTSFQDHEARIGVQSRYRVRMIRADDVTGDWSSTVSISLTSGQVALSFSSNAATGMGCLYPEVWDTRSVTRTWDFKESDDVKVTSIYGRDKYVAFRPIERKGDGFSRTVMLSALCTVSLPSMNVFQPLRDLSWAGIPYVCVRDGEGNRWFATLRVTGGVSEVVEGEKGDLWFAQLDVLEVSAEPAIFDSLTSPVDGVRSISDFI